MALSPNYGGFGIVNGVNYYQCCQCQICHFPDEQIYKKHIGFQSKHGIFQMTQKDFINMRLEQVKKDTEDKQNERT